MAYFNSAFHKTFLGTVGINTTTTDSSADVAEDTKGTFALTDCNFNVVDVAHAAITGGKNLHMVSTSVLDDDKIGPFHGGYKETNKSKMINPKYVSEVYRVDPVTPVSQMIAVGQTSVATGNAVPCFECDSTYDIRLDVKGSPGLRFLNHHIYENISYSTGCCPADGGVENTDPITAMIAFAQYINEDPILSKFLRVGVEGTVDNGVSWDFYSDDTAMFGGLGAASTASDGGLFSAYVSAYDFGVNDTDYSAGLVIEASYVDTKFGDCTFEPCDFYEREPLGITASLIDFEGNPCPDCANLESSELRASVQGMGFGETCVRSLILSEEYRQNRFHTGSDSRIKEVTQGYDILGSVDRTTMYTTYYIKHSVPRFNNPSGTFDNDQYMLCIITTGTNATLETLLETWLTAANNPIGAEITASGFLAY